MSKIRFSKTTEPSVPNTDKAWVYLDIDSKLKLKTDTGVVFDLTASGTAGGSSDSKALTGSDGIVVVSGSSTINIAGFRSEFVNASGTLQADINNKQPLDPGLTALAGLTSSGIAVLTGPDTWSARYIDGLTHQIHVYEGSGVAGNITLGLAADPIVPGSGAITVMSGSTGARPYPPTEGMFRYNSDGQEFEGYTTAGWAPIVDTNDLRLNH